MILVMNPSTSAYFNLACEEYLAKKTQEDMFMVWTSEPSILLGKHQNAYSEVNMEYVAKHAIPVVRRMSGGGTVFCDRGNMNFTFIEGSGGGFADFKRFTQPILGYLESLGAQPVFSGRNDLLLDGMKFSGNAQYKTGGTLVHHGTLLFDAVLSDLSKALTPHELKFKDKAVKSVASRVTNIKSHIKDSSLTVEGFRQGLYDYIENHVDGARRYHLSDKDQADILSLVDTKYASHEWNYGKSPRFSVVHRDKTSAGLLEVCLSVEKGVVKELMIYGDFFGSQPTEDLCERFIGLTYEKAALMQVFETLDLDQYIKGASPQMIVDLML